MYVHPKLRLDAIFDIDIDCFRFIACQETLLTETTSLQLLPTCFYLAAADIDIESGVGRVAWCLYCCFVDSFMVFLL